MDLQGRSKFGIGQRELTGAVDLINHYKLWAHHEFFCKRPLHLSVSETHYLHSLVGDTEIRRGDRMELIQLVQETSYGWKTDAHIQPFDLDTLRESFQLRETTPIDLPSPEKGIPTIAGISKIGSEDKEQKHKKHKERDKKKNKEHKKHKHRHKDKEHGNDKDKEKKDKSGRHESSADYSKKRQDKKLNGNEEPSDTHGHKKSKHKSSKMSEKGGIKVAG